MTILNSSIASSKLFAICCSVSSSVDAVPRALVKYVHLCYANINNKIIPVKS